MEDMELDEVVADAIRKMRERDQSKALEAAVKYLERQGLVVLDRDLAYDDLPGRADLVLADEGAVVLATVDTAPEAAGAFPEPKTSLGEMWVLLQRWCKENDHDPSEARVDAVSMLVIDGHRGFVRWNKNRVL